MISQSLSLAHSRFLDYLELTKFRLVSLVLLSAAVGFFLASSGPVDLPLLFTTLLGTVLVAAGSMTLNQRMEHIQDGRMNRTASRPIPTGRIQPHEATVFGILLSGFGLLILFMGVNLAATFLAALTLISYLLIYTPLKKKTTLCTIVGAIPGALPALVGWAAAAGKPSFQAWILFAIIFFWQMPHFLAIAWLYRKDFSQAGFKMLSVNDPDGKQVGRQTILYTLALLPVSLMPTIFGMTGFIYFFGALVLGLGFVAAGISSLKQMDQKARSLFRVSILYLTLLLILMVVDKV